MLFRSQFIQITWPHAGTDWVDMLDEVNLCFAEIARNIIRFESLLIVCMDIKSVQDLLGAVDFSKITFVELPSNDTWARDHGGITVIEDGKKVIYDFAFNGWGLKFDADLDNQITRKLFKKGVFDKDTTYRNCLNFVLEGGSFESDGAGTLLTTSTCLLSENRNGLSKEDTEDKLKDYFGLNRLLWLNHGYLVGDDTDSHIDTLTRFCDAETIAYIKCEDATDEHYEELKKMEAELQQFTSVTGKSYRLIPLPMADSVYENGERLPATYANFLIVNGAVLVPTYQSPKDDMALMQIQKAFPDRKSVV